ncbi:MAG: 4Fe-4S dicluster domain-containing protein [Oscillospiraceae bacterium]|nr:4Fe-4S dicluster domain-containing protein [Oscillospiraceae bacterium]
MDNKTMPRASNPLSTAPPFFQSRKPEYDRFFHSVRLDSDLCKGCINCLKRCPTQAIRVRDGKSQITKEYCTDCGECIRACPHHAKKATFDSFDTLSEYEYKIALPPPSLYAQFNNLEEKSLVLNALLSLGFDDVYEVAAAAELVSEITRKLIKDLASGARDNLPQGGFIPGSLPIISSACPCVVRLISVKFPNLLDNISPVIAPVEMAANAAVRRALIRTGLPREKIGVFFISPCPAKVAEAYSPLGIKESQIDKVLAVSDIYPRLLPFMKEIAASGGDMTSFDRGSEFSREIDKAGRIGVSWGGHGGEASGLLTDNYLAVDGIESVIKSLEDLEDSKFTNLEFIELNACKGGCVGGVLVVENPYIAKVKLNIIRKYLPVSGTHINASVPPYAYNNKKIEFQPVYRLGQTLEESISMMKRVDELIEKLPGLDCGCCGAPTCAANAEDVAKGLADEKGCIHKRVEALETESKLSNSQR